MKQLSKPLLVPAGLAFTIITVVGLAALPPDAEAAKQNLEEYIHKTLAGDDAFTTKERGRLQGALKSALAAYTTDVLRGQKKQAAETLMRVVAEGSMDRLPAERIADVAAAAYKAVRRGSPADVVEGIALYGFRKKVDDERLAAWANGHREMTKNGLPDEVAADLIRNAMERGWDVRTFNTLKWALVAGRKKGHDPYAYAHYVLGNMQKKGARPGQVSSRAAVAFKKSKTPKLPGSYKPLWAKPKPQATRPVPELKPAPKRPVPEIKPAPKAAKPKSSGGLWASIRAAIDSFIGTPYVWGGTTRQGCDCSGFVKTVYDEHGVALPRVSKQQWKTGKPVKFKNLKSGDLVFFNTMGSGVSHVGVCVDGKGPMFAHASSSRGVVIDNLSKRYYQKRYLGARRVLK